MEINLTPKEIRSWSLLATCAPSPLVRDQRRRLGRLGRLGLAHNSDLLIESDASAAKIDPRTLWADLPQPSHSNKSSCLTQQYTHVVVYCC